jgi:hypothetical protein
MQLMICFYPLNDQVHLILKSSGYRREITSIILFIFINYCQAIKIMKYTVILICFFLISISQVLFSQTATVIIFHPTFGNSNLTSNTFYIINNTDSIQITALKFYISNIELMDEHKMVWKDSIHFHLLDGFNDTTFSVNIPENVTYTKVKFNLGIDSITNVSGAMGGDLDPTKGMYWTWQSGYINFKLEGTSNLCKTRHNEFQFHLGGYQYPFNSLQTVFIDVIPKQNIELGMDIQKILSSINLSKQHHIMSPGQEAIIFSETIIKSLSSKK